MLASSMTEDVPWLVKVELIEEWSINTTIGVGVAAISSVKRCWMDLIIDFLAKDQLPNDEKEASKVRQVAAQYWLLADCKLYRRSFGGSYLLCLHPKKVNELLSELHDGMCGSHVGGHFLAHQAMTQGFWWPQM